jgi:hypothetical protein
MLGGDTAREENMLAGGAWHQRKALFRCTGDSQERDITEKHGDHESATHGREKVPVKCGRVLEDAELATTR